jgi:hypothetical protein
MTPAVLTLVDFLEARLAEDEVFAQSTPRQAMTIIPADGSARTAARIAEHAERWQPIRVLREVEAKRRIVTLHSDWHVCVSGRGPGATDYVGNEDDSWGEPCPTLRALASMYSEHPHYREEWA